MGERGRRPGVKRKKGAIQWGRTTFIRYKQLLLTGVLLTALLLLLFGICNQLQAPDLNAPPMGTTVIDYGTFLAQVRAGHVLEVSLQDQDIVGLLAKPVERRQVTQTKMSPSPVRADPGTEYDVLAKEDSNFGVSPSTASPPLVPADLVFTRLPGRGDAMLIPLLVSKHVVIKMLPSAQLPPWLSLLWKPLPFLFLLLMLVRVLFPDRRVRSPSTIGDERHVHRFWKRAAPERRASEEPEAHGGDTSPRDRSVHEDTSSPVRPELKPPSVTFADIAGIDEVRREVEELVQFLRAPERFERLGARIPRGALLVGPPGTGKTLLAKAVAGEAGVSFFSVSASEFVEMYVGVGAKRVRDLFGKAREHAPCVIFLDELDAVGRKRTPGLSGSDEREQTLNQLLVELDGFATRQTIVVLAATNRADILDPALLRPGRFDRHISVSLPDRAGRQAILQVHTRRTPLHEEVSLESLAVTQFVAEEDRYNHSRERLMARLAVGLGGRAAEELAFGHERVTTGAENDFQVVTGLARNMVTRWGMSERVGVMFVEGRVGVSAGRPNLRYHNGDASSAHSRTLVADAAGRLLLNGGDSPQHRSVPVDATSSEASRSSMAT